MPQYINCIEPPIDVPFPQSLPCNFSVSFHLTHQSCNWLWPIEYKGNDDQPRTRLGLKRLAYFFLVPPLHSWVYIPGKPWTCPLADDKAGRGEASYSSQSLLYLQISKSAYLTHSDCRNLVETRENVQ